MPRQWSWLVLLMVSLLAACSADQPLNPSFPLTVAQADEELESMRAQPRALQRPVVVLGGYVDPGILPMRVAAKLRKLTGDERMISLGFAFCGDFDDCRGRLIDAVQEAWPSDDPRRTIEVDVVAISMGGLVARYAACHDDETQPRRLQIARLFTIGTPHQGAALATLPTLDRCQIAMRPRSGFLEQLNGDMDTTTYPIFAYVRLGDAIVGAENAAPHGRTAWWVANQPLQFAHIMAPTDPRILADIARRLRGERAYASEPAAVLPR